MEEFIVFINTNGKGTIVKPRNYEHSFEEFDFHVTNNTKINKSLMQVDGYGVTNILDIEKAFKPRKFYRVRWREEVLSTMDGDSYTDIIEYLEEIKNTKFRGKS